MASIQKMIKSIKSFQIEIGIDFLLLLFLIAVYFFKTTDHTMQRQSCCTDSNKKIKHRWRLHKNYENSITTLKIKFKKLILNFIGQHYEVSAVLVTSSLKIQVVLHIQLINLNNFQLIAKFSYRPQFNYLFCSPNIKAEYNFICCG